MRYASSEDDLEFSFDSGPRKSPIDKTKDLKKKNKCFYIIVIISVIVLLFVGIFLAIFFASKIKNDGGHIQVEVQSTNGGKIEIFREVDLEKGDYEVINENEKKNIRILSGENDNIQIFNPGEEKNFTIKFNKILTSLNGMFADKDFIKSVDFSGLVTKKIINMNKLFYNCTNLEIVNFNNFNSEKLETMDSSFENCHNLSSIDLSSFKTPKLYSMNSAFKNCTKLYSLNIINFILNSNLQHDKLLYGIKNITNFQYPDNNDIIKSEIEKANFSPIDDCKTNKSGCDICDLDNNIKLNVCTSCKGGYFLPDVTYPFGCNKCMEHCLNCTNEFVCIECDGEYTLYNNKCIKNTTDPTDPTYITIPSSYVHGTDVNDDSPIPTDFSNNF